MVDAPALDDKVVLDTETVETVRGLGDPTFLPRLLDTFKDATDSDLAKMSAARSDGDAQLVSETAHSIKSAALNLGAVRFAALCEWIEHNAPSAGLDGVAGGLDKMPAEYDTAMTALRAEVD